jgi:hypothetical protein
MNCNWAVAAYFIVLSRDSIVGIATGWAAEKSGFDSRQE